MQSNNAVSDTDQLDADYLYGKEQIERWGSKKKLSKQGGLLVVQHQSDVERLAAAQLLSVGLIRSPHTPEQIEHIAYLARLYADRRLQTWLPLDLAGRKAMWQLVTELLSEAFVRVPITSKTEDGRFAERSPRDLTDEELYLAADIIRR